MKLREGDTVMVITGKDAGTESRIAHVFPEKNRIIVEGVATAKRSQKPTGELNTGGIIDKEMPIDRSNLKLFNPVSQKGDRIGIKKLEDGRKVRFFKSNNEVVDV